MLIERLVRSLSAALPRRDLTHLAMPAALLAGLAHLLGQRHSSAVETLSDPGSSHRRRRRRTRHKRRNGQHSHHRPGQQQQRKACSKSGEIPHKGKACCKGLIRDGTGTCAQANTTCDVCASGCRYATLQATVDAATAGDTIKLCAGTFSGAEIGVDIDVEGNGEDTVLTRMSTGITTAETTGRVIRILPERRVVLRDLQITGGLAEAGISAAAARGVGVENGGNLRLVRVTVADNEAIDRGGGINNVGQLTVTDSTVSGNTSANRGAGIDNSGTTTLDNSRVTDNHATTDGGGFFSSGGTVTLRNDASVSGNTPNNCVGFSATGCAAP